ncbi:BON domain-containing protein [Undibacterium sp. RTI2.1]|uniref:BON domain-containing protein n=1 Tax=unclassified Undibacterium TaxID=2630295 RepID=UPI002B234C2E|nr:MULTISPECIES: BON domain-containing protein [unclassified Undibacterium]MEB0030688.1 BON domain-containing protein [Undibacterium sp. RTI2.1]MEB0117193.1 BON domain-containing protein [Undibacterium sp. RTI2.2]
MQNRSSITSLIAASVLSMTAASSFAADTVVAQADKPTMTEKAGVAVDDSMITAKVKSALVADKEVSALKINVTTKQGVVILTGAVPSVAASDRVLKMVASIEGVKDIQNQLQVSQG